MKNVKIAICFVFSILMPIASIGQTAPTSRSTVSLSSSIPYRIISGTNFTSGDVSRWPFISGKCIAVKDSGLILQTFATNNTYQNVFIEGHGTPGAYSSVSDHYEKRLVSSDAIPDKQIFILNYPHSTEGESIRVQAIRSGTQNIDGHILEVWDCGMAPTAQQLSDYEEALELARRELEAKQAAERQAVLKAVEDKRRELQANTVTHYQGLADKGDAYGQLRMGEFYRDGNGVPQDTAKAKDLFAQSAAQGNPDAAHALDKLNAANPK